MSAALWDQVDAVLELDQPAGLVPARDVPIQRRRRRGYSPREADPRAAVELVRDNDGVLRWVYRSPAATARTGRRVYRSAHLGTTEVVKRFSFHDLQPNQVTQALVALDARLTPEQGMKQLRGGALAGVQQPKAMDETLLLVHGTFSQSRMFTDQLGATPQGQALLQHWQSRYQGIYAFDHPTLSVGAWSNAVDLMHAMENMRGPIDIVCHSRGGLVVSWLLRLAQVPVRSVTFVGSPLAGTSLASPPRLRAALDMMANFGETVADIGDAAGTVLPIAAGAAGIARIFGKVLRLGSSLPIVDAGVSLVPGLASQQLTSNNLERNQLLAAEWKVKPKLQGIGGYFRPNELDAGWKFWKRFSNVGNQLMASAADLVFEGENDLVVDVLSMSQLGGRGPVAFTDLGTSAVTHHCNYFKDPRVLAQLQKL
jgi:pimeloyl-ACP methyl ester carboxylesterase